MGPESQCSIDSRTDTEKARVQERARQMEDSTGRSTHKFLEVEKTNKNEESELVGKMRNTDITEEPQNCSCHMGMATSLDFFLSEMDIQ